jgi:hypothetical protein
MRCQSERLEQGIYGQPPSEWTEIWSNFQHLAIAYALTASIG